MPLTDQTMPLTDQTLPLTDQTLPLTDTSATDETVTLVTDADKGGYQGKNLSMLCLKNFAKFQVCYFGTK